jgi:hypothetical protein
LPLAPAVLAQETPDQAEVVLDFDFSGSILDDERTRNRFGDAIYGIADRVAETQNELIKGDTTVSLVQFASQAVNVDGCTDIELQDSPDNVARFEDCLRRVAADYKSGGNATLRGKIGRDTNYVAAMQRAAEHIPTDVARPTLIFFSDGRHDVDGVPASAVGPERDRLFGARTPFALLPVGLAVDPADRPALEAGLNALKITRAMPACRTGGLLTWPDVAFDGPDKAAGAVALALQNATCTFTAEPTPSPEPTVAPPPNVVRNIRLTPQDGKIEVRWTPPVASALPDPITDYVVQCTPDGGEPVASQEGVSTERETVVGGLENGTEYRCEVAIVTASGQGEFAESGARATPTEVPGPPDKPSVLPLNGGLLVEAAQPDGSVASSYKYECSSDNGATWPATASALTPDDSTAQIGGLSNGTAYVCRAFASNDSGTSEASPLSDAIVPCATFLDCNGLELPVLGGLAVLVLGAILIGLFFLFRDRGGGYTVAVVDVVHTANLGGGSNVGLAFVGAPRARSLDGIVAAKGKKADVRIHRLRGGRFRVEDKHGSHVVDSGEPVVVSDQSGVRHELVVRAFEGKAASAVSTRPG